MLRYRALLIDTEKTYAKPIQAVFQSMEPATAWAKAVLAGASHTASVVFYRTIEEEMHSLCKADFKEPNDQGAKQDIQETAKASGEPS